MSLMYSKNKSGPSTEPCGIPQFTYEMGELTRDLRIVFFLVRIESRVESAVRFVFESNLRIESAVYTTQAVTQPDGLQAYRTGL